MTHIKWLDTYPDGCFFSNREMIDDPTLKPEGWFNPFTEPDKLVEELERFPTAKSIKEYLEEFYPGIDPEPYRKRKIDENKQRDIKYCCSTWIWKFDPVKQKYIKCLKRCKHWNDCPPCKLWKIEKHKERLERLYDKRVVIAKTEDEEKAIKAGRSQNDYLRILRRDGTTAFILNEKPQNDNEKMSNRLIGELSEDMLPNEKRGRYSGKLGHSPIVVENEEKGDREEIEVDAWMIRFTDESTLKDNKELEAKVLGKMQIDWTNERTIETLGLVVKEVDRILEEVCLEHKIDKQFLYRETIYISMNEVEWKWLPQKE
jgi:hypothetical protein